MKKLLLSLLILSSLFMVSCTPSNNLLDSGVKIEDVIITGNIFEAKLVIEETPSNLELLKEIVTSSIYLVYDNYKLEFGQKSYTLFFSIYIDDVNVGNISYKVNSSVEKPGLTYIADTLELS